MRILIVHSKYRIRGGEDAVVEQEAAMLREHGHVVRVYLRSNDEIKGWKKWVRLPFSAVWSLHSAKEINDILRDFKPDVMHVHNTWMVISQSCCWVGKKHGVPVVQTLHNYRLFCPAGVFFRDGHTCEDCAEKFFPWPGIFHRCYRRSWLDSLFVASVITIHKMLKTWQNEIHVYIALSEFSKKKFIACGMKSDKVVLKPNFVDPDPGRSGCCGDYALFAGQLTSGKGIQCLLSALPLIGALPIKIAGAGPLGKEVFKTVHSLNSSKIEFLGEKSRKEVMDLIKKSRFLIFPSQWYECFPMIIIEAFACGKPVLASRMGVMQEIVEEGRTGRFFEPGNSTDLAQKIKELFEDSKACEAMGKEARIEFEKKYSVEQNIVKLIGIYELAIKTAQRRKT